MDKFDQLLYRHFPHLVMEIMKRYFRLEVEGMEHIPSKGPAIITPNHSGYSGFDALILAHEINQQTGRIARVMMHHFWFLNEFSSTAAQKIGFVEATFTNGLKQLSKNNLLILFPEGEYGNFKTSAKMYELQEFRRGFVSLALEKQCPIVPCLIIGAEESHINLSQIKLGKRFAKMVMPLPLNIIPLPVKWKIKFLPPIHLPYTADKVDDRELVREISSSVREQMQRALREEIKKRPSWFGFLK